MPKEYTNDNWYEIRWVDNNTVFLCVSVGHNISAYKNGTSTSRTIFEAIETFWKGGRSFKTIEELYNWCYTYASYDLQEKMMYETAELFRKNREKRLLEK